MPAQASIYNSLGASAHAHGDLPGAKEHFERALEITRRTGDAVMAGVCSNNIGETALDQGRIEEAGARLRDALRASQASGMRYGMALAKRSLGRVACWTGNGDAALALLNESLEETEAAGGKFDSLDRRPVSPRSRSCSVTLRPRWRWPTRS